ncbi:UNVERIFIED_CONTAM: hypothetical protein NCL1_46474 [Trichonephila clavipes]
MTIIYVFIYLLTGKVAILSASNTLYFSLVLPTGLAPPHFLKPSPQGSQLESMFTVPSIQSESNL